MIWNSGGVRILVSFTRASRERWLLRFVISIVEKLARERHIGISTVVLAPFSSNPPCPLSSRDVPQHLD